MVLSFLTGIFKKKVAKKHENHTEDESVKIKGAFDKVKGEIEALKKEYNEISVKMAAHNNLIKEHEKELRKQVEEINKQNLKVAEHSDKISTLEEFVKHREPVASQLVEPTKRLNQGHPQLVVSKMSTGQSASEINWDGFTPQEKRIIGVFMENKDMPLSYEDVGKVLNKASSTIKNQMKNIELKGKIFEENRDNEQRKRFMIKNGLRINRSID